MSILLIVFLVLIFTLYLYLRIKGCRSVASYSNHILEAETALKDLCLPTHKMTAQDSNEYRHKYISLYNIASEIQNKKKYKFVSQSVIEKAGINSFINAFNKLDSLMYDNNHDYEALETAKNNIDLMVSVWESLTAPDNYFAGSDMDTYREQFEDVVIALKRIKSRGLGQYLIPEQNSACSKILSNLDDIEEIRDQHNKQFTQDQLEENKDYFDKVLSYPLDPQQRQSIVSLEDNTLVVSAAGSGKTTTTVGRVRYLIDKRNIYPSRILLISYTRKAANELKQRIGSSSIRCCTFHRLAMDIIGNSTGSKPSIADSTIFEAVFAEMMSKHSFISAVNTYYTEYLSFTKDEFQYEHAEDYFADRKKYGIQSIFTDMDGHVIMTKSEQEKHIVNFLVKNGIQFRYEEPYEIDTFNKEYRQYKPDFSIHYVKDGKHCRLYLEHFGIDKNNRVPQWFGDGRVGGWLRANQIYNESIQWKKDLHLKNNTTMICTTSAQFTDGTVYENLRKELLFIGVPFNPIPEEELYNRIIQNNKKVEKNLLNLICEFISLMKSNLMSIDSIKSDAIKNKDERAVFIIDNLIKPYYDEYQARLARNGDIDFTDAINQAADLCAKGQNPFCFDYILVDEFQDISKDRYRLLQAVRCNSPLTKLFCVGDDWQSIYRFSGSDMALFYKFREYFGYTNECRIESTYRFGEPLISISSKFILENPNQKFKQVHGQSQETNIQYKPYSDSYPEINLLADLLSTIPEDKTAYILGRYSFDADFIFSYKSKYTNAELTLKEEGNNQYIVQNGRKFQFMDVHQAKGLEADYIILLNCNSGIYGFPAAISDDPILDYLLSENDHFEFGEERRIFYVAITRAKKQVYVLYDSKKPSVFVSESNQTDRGPICPVCKLGRKVVLRTNVASNGTPYTVYGCSNSDAGCPYFERKFG